MDPSELSQEQAPEPPKIQSVAASILAQFFDALEKEEGFAEVAPNLRKVVLDEGIFAEPSIRSVLLPDAP